MARKSRKNIPDVVSSVYDTLELPKKSVRIP